MSRRRKRSDETRTLRIGKNGITDGFIEEAREQLEKGREIKVNLPRGLEHDERDAMAQELADKTGAILLDRRGNTAVLRKR